MKELKESRGKTILRFFADGFSLGIAAGFGYWVFHVSPSRMPYLSGVQRIGPQIEAAMSAAGTLWIWTLLVGGLAGGVIALIIAAACRKCKSLCELITVSSAGIYLLALRGAWSISPKGTMPVLSLVLPATLVFIAIFLLAYFEARAMRSHREEGSSARILTFHFCLSLGAAHIMMQLPYYSGCIPAFFSNLRDIGFLLTGF